MAPIDATLEILKKIQGSIGDLRQDVQGNSRSIDAMSERIGAVEGRLESVEGRLESVEGRLESVEGCLESVEGRLDAHGRRLGGIEARLHELVDVTSLSVTRQLDLAHRVDALEGRVEALERR